MFKPSLLSLVATKLNEEVMCTELQNDPLTIQELSFCNLELSVNI